MLSLNSLFFTCCRIRGGVTSLAPISSGLKTDVEKKLGLPPKPKRPPNSYCLFIRKIMPEIQARYPKLTPSEQFKTACTQWKSVDPKVLKELEEMAHKERLKYTQALEKYNSSVTIEEKAALREALAADKLSKEKKALRKKLIALGMPKKPMNSYLLFVSDWLNKNPKVLQKEANQKCAIIWKGLPDDEKLKWQSMHKRLEDDYHKKLKTWEADMIRQGKLEITYDSILKKSIKGDEISPLTKT